MRDPRRMTAVGRTSVVVPRGNQGEDEEVDSSRAETSVPSSVKMSSLNTIPPTYLAWKTCRGGGEPARRNHSLRKRLRNAGDDPVTGCPTLLTRKIFKAPLPPKFKMPPMASYDGTTNPQHHIADFNLAIFMARVGTYEVKCLVFPMMLSG